MSLSYTVTPNWRNWREWCCSTSVSGLSAQLMIKVINSVNQNCDSYILSLCVVRAKIFIMFIQQQKKNKQTKTIACIVLKQLLLFLASLDLLWNEIRSQWLFWRLWSKSQDYFLLPELILTLHLLNQSIKLQNILLTVSNSHDVCLKAGTDQYSWLFKDFFISFTSRFSSSGSEHACDDLFIIPWERTRDRRHVEPPCSPDTGHDFYGPSISGEGGQRLHPEGATGGTDRRLPALYPTVF